MLVIERNTEVYTNAFIQTGIVYKVIPFEYFEQKIELVYVYHNWLSSNHLTYVLYYRNEDTTWASIEVAPLPEQITLRVIGEY